MWRNTREALFLRNCQVSAADRFQLNGGAVLVVAFLLFGCQAQTEDASYAESPKAVENAAIVDFNDATDLNVDYNLIENEALAAEVNDADTFANGIPTSGLPDNTVGNAADPPAPSPVADPRDNAAEIEPGLGAFVKPGDMEVGNWHSLEFVVGPDKPSIEGETEGLSLAQPRSIYVSSAMRVTLLRDLNFEIQPKTPALQLTGADKTASWQWNVKPLRDGSHRLEAKVEVLEQTADGKYEFVDEYTSRVDISVEVGTWEGFLNALRNGATLGDVLTTLFKAWEKTLLALAALITAAFGVWWAVRKGGQG